MACDADRRMRLKWLRNQTLGGTQLQVIASFWFSSLVHAKGTSLSEFASEQGDTPAWRSLREAPIVVDPVEAYLYLGKARKD